MSNRTVMIISAALVVIPVQAMADDDVTIRLMKQQENTEQAVLHRIELPEKALENASENALVNGQQFNREQLKHRNRKQEGETEYQNQQHESDEQQEERLNDSQQERQEAYRVMEQRQEGMVIEDISPVTQESLRP